MTAGAAAEDECDEADEGEASAQVTGQYGEASGLDAGSDVIQHWEILVLLDFMPVGPDDSSTISCLQRSAHQR